MNGGGDSTPVRSKGRMSKSAGFTRTLATDRQLLVHVTISSNGARITSAQNSAPSFSIPAAEGIGTIQRTSVSRASRRTADEAPAWPEVFRDALTHRVGRRARDEPRRSALCVDESRARHRALRRGAPCWREADPYRAGWFDVHDGASVTSPGRLLQTARQRGGPQPLRAVSPFQAPFHTNPRPHLDEYSGAVCRVGMR